MRLLIIFAFLALICIGRSIPLEDDVYYENPSIGDYVGDDVSSTTTTTTATTKRRSTYTLSTKRPWLTQRTTTIAIDDDFNENEGDFKYFGNIRKIFKKIWAEVKKLIGNLNISDIINFIKQYIANRKDDD